MCFEEFNRFACRHYAIKKGGLKLCKRFRCREPYTTCKNCNISFKLQKRVCRVCAKHSARWAPRLEAQDSEAYEFEFNVVDVQDVEASELEGREIQTPVVQALPPFPHPHSDAWPQPLSANNLSNGNSAADSPSMRIFSPSNTILNRSSYSSVLQEPAPVQVTSASPERGLVIYQADEGEETDEGITTDQGVGTDKEAETDASSVELEGSSTAQPVPTLQQEGEREILHPDLSIGGGGWEEEDQSMDATADFQSPQEPQQSLDTGGVILLANQLGEKKKVGSSAFKKRQVAPDHKQQECKTLI